MRSKNILVLFSVIVICELAGVIGAVFTTAAITPSTPSINSGLGSSGQATWYAGLAKPVLNPPAWVFAPVWTILYLLMGISVFLIFIKEGNNGFKKRALWMFAVQLILNVLWTALFFGLHSPLLGLICIIALWLAIIWTMAAFWTISRPATLLLAPYLLWVTFAAYLNLAIFLLNR